MLEFLQLSVAYLSTEFVILPRMKKAESKSVQFVKAALVHFLAGMLMINIGLDSMLLFAVASLSLIHPGIHSAQIYFSKKFRINDGSWKLFLANQAVCISAIYVAAMFCTGNFHHLKKVIPALLESERLYLFSAVYIGVVFAGGVLVQKICDFFLKSIPQDMQKKKPGLPLAGRYIGWLERSLLFFFVVSELDEAIGFLLALKALARYPEISEDKKGHFGEYFLVGTLTSFGVALVGGVVVRALK